MYQLHAQIRCITRIINQSLRLHMMMMMMMMMMMVMMMIMMMMIMMMTNCLMTDWGSKICTHIWKQFVSQNCGATAQINSAMAAPLLVSGRS